VKLLLKLIAKGIISRGSAARITDEYLKTKNFLFLKFI
jgi:hypothetical protein